MLVYPEDKTGWVTIAGQGFEYHVKEYKTVEEQDPYTVIIDVYDDSVKGAWFHPQPIQQLLDDETNWEKVSYSEDHAIIEVQYVKSLGYPPAQPRKGFSFNPWRIINSNQADLFTNGEEILHKFSALSGFPHINGIFYEEVED